MPERPDTAITCYTIDGPDDLRRHLDDLNDAGVSPIAVGVDAIDQPFLITLVGPYAEREDVFFDSPWQREHDHGGVPSRCEDCDAYSHTIDHLRFPVTVVVPGADSGRSTDV